MKKLSILIFLIPLQLWAGWFKAKPQLQAPHPHITEALNREINGKQFRIPQFQALVWMKRFNISMDQLLIELSAYAKQHATPAISGYKVGIAGLARTTHNIYLGNNLEFPRRPIKDSLHGEQFMLALAHAYNEEGFETVVSATGKFCGHCRQLLKELNPAPRMIMMNEQFELSEILPHAFGPKEMGSTTGMLTHEPTPLELVVERNDLVEMAHLAATRSYAPYSKGYSGVALRTKNNSIFFGSFLESAAYNPSIAPLQAALASLVAHGHQMSDITEAVLFEPPFADNMHSHHDDVKGLLKQISPEAEYRRVTPIGCQDVL